MASKQKSIFDKEPVKVQPRNEQTKTEDEFISFEDSIFAKNKKSKVIVQPKSLIPKDDFVPIEDSIFCPKYACHEENDKDDEDNNLFVHDDEVPFEDSIFARHKKKVPIVYKLPKENKVDLEELFKKYQHIYMNDYIINVKKLYMINANTFDVCCMNLERSRGAKYMNTDTYDLVKRVIKSACVGVADTFYCYTNMSKTLLDLVSEMNPDMDIDVMYHIIDRSYAEAIDEFGGKRWQKS